MRSSGVNSFTSTASNLRAGGFDLGTKLSPHGRGLGANFRFRDGGCFVLSPAWAHAQRAQARSSLMAIRGKETTNGHKAARPQAKLNKLNGACRMQDAARKKTSQTER